MQLFLTCVLPFLAHDHASAVAFLTCRYHNFHGSIIPEFLSDGKRAKAFYKARQQNQLYSDDEKQYPNLYNLFVQTPLMQFSPSLVLRQKDSAESILKPLLKTKYFTRTLQRCAVERAPTSDILQALSKVQSLTKLDLIWLENQQLDIIMNSFPSLETLTIQNAGYLQTVDATAISISSPCASALKTLKTLTLNLVDAMFAIQFIPYFTRLQKLDVSGDHSRPELDLLPLSCSLSLLTDLTLTQFNPQNVESLKNLVHLSSVALTCCRLPDSLSFLTPENHLPHLTKLLIRRCNGLSTSSFAFLTHAPNLRVLEVTYTDFDDDCLKYLDNMIHLRKLDLSCSNITSDNQSFKTLRQNLFQLEELNLDRCHYIGNQGAISGALYSTHSRLRVLKFEACLLLDDLKGIGALKNTLEVLNLRGNNVTNGELVHLGDLVKLKNLSLGGSVDDLSPLKDCLNLEELNVWECYRLADDSFKVFSEEPNSFFNLRILHLPDCDKLTDKVFKHLSKNIHLVVRLQGLNVGVLGKILSSSAAARNNLCQLKGLRRLNGILSSISSESDRNKLKDELMQILKNLEEVD